MNNNEFQDLFKFANNIEKITDKKIKKQPKKKFRLKYFFKKIFIMLIYFIKKIVKKINFSFTKIKDWLIFKKDLMIIKKNFNFKIKRKCYSYKIVETKKQRGNKTIIVRKRVPFYFDINSFKSSFNDFNSVFYLSGKDRKEGDSNNYFFKKNSIWDFPVEEKRFRDFVFNRRK